LATPAAHAAVPPAAAQWARLTPARAKVERNEELFTTISGDAVKPLYTPLDLAGFDYARDLGFPGEYPQWLSLCGNRSESGSTLRLDVFAAGTHG